VYLQQIIFEAVEADGTRKITLLTSVEILKGVLVSITSLSEGDLMVSWICSKIGEH